MKIIDYDKLHAAFKPSGYVSKDANVIANSLICEFPIQAGNGLARFLNVDSCFDNHMAMRVWVQKRLDANSGILLMRCAINWRASFIDYCHKLAMVTEENAMSVKLQPSMTQNAQDLRVCADYWAYSNNDGYDGYIEHVNALCCQYEISLHVLFETIGQCFDPCRQSRRIKLGRF